MLLLQSWQATAFIVVTLLHIVFGARPDQDQERQEGIQSPSFALPASCHPDKLSADTSEKMQEHSKVNVNMQKLLDCAKDMHSAGRQLQKSMRVAAWRNNRYRQAFQAEVPFWDWLGHTDAVENLVAATKHDGQTQLSHHVAGIQDILDELAYYGTVKKRQEHWSLPEEDNAKGSERKGEEVDDDEYRLPKEDFKDNDMLPHPQGSALEGDQTPHQDDAASAQNGAHPGSASHSDPTTHQDDAQILQHGMHGDQTPHQDDAASLEQGTPTGSAVRSDQTTPQGGENGAQAKGAPP